MYKTCINEYRINYPIPCYLQNSYKFLGYKEGDFPITVNYANEILSLPMSEHLREEEIEYVAQKIKEFYNNR
ncbi:MAG: DegT/DnrJ/EryC1/StrS family aminotransferase [Candidatus Marinimicrobia bacterium]|nr:DegT/DnrJ/EryC1/StrS family aminotransferase [Candidatus Neomarinimicrobiota bacterium]MCK4446663.1 DegT/DnrJ/EryC1/StrS family aminotransferase [Candidatus Neomarinimicrobiota bacterium]